jgi:chorismate synthase
MKIESDRVEILGGIRFGRTLGSPVALGLVNRDHENWLESMAVDGPAPPESRARGVTRPRPGHADLAGALKYGTHDAREILERASARETAARVAAGGLARALLDPMGIEVTSRTLAVGKVLDGEPEGGEGAIFERLRALPDDAPFRVADPELSRAMAAEVDRARAARDSIGGVFEVLARGVPPGLGSHVHWDRRIDGRIGGALLSIPAVKAASVGEGIESSARLGSETHDAIGWDPAERRFVRPSNRAGGIEGGMTNGEIVRARGYLKPLATLPRPLPSVDLATKEPFEAAVERTDTIPIVAAGVVAEAMLCLILADELLVKCGGDSLEETRRNLEAYRQSLRAF